MASKITNLAPERTFKFKLGDKTKELKVKALSLMKLRAMVEQFRNKIQADWKKEIVELSEGLKDKNAFLIEALKSKPQGEELERELERYSTSIDGVKEFLMAGLNLSLTDVNKLLEDEANEQSATDCYLYIIGSEYDSEQLKEMVSKEEAKKAQAEKKS